MQKRPRQAPVSCQLCRSMKLKCNRELPCSNCTSRGVPCERAGQSSLPSNQPRSTTSSDHDDILSRLGRLEDLIIGLHGSIRPAMPQTLDVGEVWRPRESSTHSEEGHVSRWLEGVGTRSPSMVSGLSDGLTLNVLPTQLAIDELTGSSPAMKDSFQNIWLPPEPEAFCLLESYVKHVAYLHHVIHIPSLRRLTTNLYKQLRLGLLVEPSHVALVLSIFASTAYMASSSHAEDLPFATLDNAIKCASRLSKAALDVLEHSHRTTPRSLEDVQATIVLSFVFFNLEGFTTKFRSLSNMALSIARDLSLHRLDADVTEATAQRGSVADIEIKRRVWWHLVSTDWILALTGGPQEGTYLINPNHMRVFWPSNVDDAAIEGHDRSYDLPLSQPTAMTYSLLRIRLAELCRKAVDALPYQLSERERVDYDKVIALNDQFEKYLQELPYFFRLDDASREQSSDIIKRYPQIAVQRYIICFTFHSRRFKLNQPFLTRSSQDKRYQYSREVCLRSARTVIKIKQLLEHDTIPFAAMHVRLATFLHTLFLATAVLVMDLCFEKAQTSRDERKMEVVEACRMLQAAEENSAVAGGFLRPLVAILNKHEIYLPMSPTGSILPGAAFSTIMHTSAGCQLGATPSTDFAPSHAGTTYPMTDVNNFDAAWQGVIGQDPDAMNWDNWFSSLDAGVPELS